jgi:hypothetical protein
MNTNQLSRILFAISLSLSVGGCLGSVGTPGMGGGSGGGGNGGSSNADGGSMSGGNAGNAPGKLLCSATLSLSGNFQQGAAPPTDFAGGCWPSGTWTFSAQVGTNDCPNGPSLPSQFVFQVQEDADFNDTITYTTDPTNTNLSLKISGGDGGVCIGAFLIFSTDGKTVLNLRPAMQSDNSLNGQGDYSVYDTDQR